MNELIPVNIKAFKKLRTYIAENVTPKRINMQWWFSQPIRGSRNYRDLLFGDFGEHGKTVSELESCGTAGCLYGEALFALAPRRTRLYSSDAVMKIGDSLLGIPSRARYKITGATNWPIDLKSLYFSYKPANKKKALLAVIDRVIARGGIDW